MGARGQAGQAEGVDRLELVLGERLGGREVEHARAALAVRAARARVIAVSAGSR